MMITPYILSIPPYLSAPWAQVSLLYAVPEGSRFRLTVILAGGLSIVIPDLERAALDAIFEGHALYGKNASSRTIGALTPGDGDLLSFATQHNPEQAHAPDLPRDALEKIAKIAEIVGGDHAAMIQKAEPHCNCPYCQISRVFHKEAALISDEELSATDLTFSSWEIKQCGDKLYTVSNDTERYSVYLGEPLGCTCGQKNCEHIRAVLNS